MPKSGKAPREPACVLTCPPGNISSAFSSFPCVSISSGLVWISVQRTYSFCIQCSLANPSSPRIVKHQRFKCETPCIYLQFVSRSISVTGDMPNPENCHPYIQKGHEQALLWTANSSQRMGSLATHPMVLALDLNGLEISQDLNEISGDLDWDLVIFAPRSREIWLRKGVSFHFFPRLLWGWYRHP